MWGLYWCECATGGLTWGAVGYWNCWLNCGDVWCRFACWFTDEIGGECCWCWPWKIGLSWWIVDHQSGSGYAHCGLAIVWVLLGRTGMRVIWNWQNIANTCAISRVTSSDCLGLMSCWAIMGVVVTSESKTSVLFENWGWSWAFFHSSLWVLCFSLGFLVLFLCPLSGLLLLSLSGTLCWDVTSGLVFRVIG